MIMSFKLKIFKTIWVNALVIFLAVYLFGIISELISSESSIANSLFIGFIGGLYSVFGYGAMFWIGFIVATLILDLVLIRKNETNLNLKLLIEWAAISSPFVYWAFKYGTWVFLVAVFGFLLSQLYWRKRKIKKLLEI